MDTMEGAGGLEEHGSRPMRNLEHPGAVMREWWLEVEDPGEAARRLGIAPGTLRRLLDGRCDISLEIATQLEASGWSTASFWLRLQAAYDREQPRRHGSARDSASLLESRRQSQSGPSTASRRDRGVLVPRATEEGQGA